MQSASSKSPFKFLIECEEIKMLELVAIKFIHKVAAILFGINDLNMLLVIGCRKLPNTSSDVFYVRLDVSQ